MRHYSFWDQLVFRVDKVLTSKLEATIRRPNPANHIPEFDLNLNEVKHSAGLMRINHSGEVCAQALYQGQAFGARSIVTQEKLQKAAQEELDHLNWCQERLKELNSHTSYLNPFWYASAWLLGLIVGILGDKTSLGFLAETEHQVEKHLSKHLERLPILDKKSRLIVQQMRLEEIEHAATAENLGGIPLPSLVQLIMQGLAKVLTVVAYRI